MLETLETERTVTPPETDAPVLLSVRAVTKDFVLKRFAWKRGETLRAVNAASFDLHAKDTLGIVGESGSGKSTLARMVVRLLEPTSGNVMFEDRDLQVLSPADVLKLVRPKMRMIFQDPDAVLNPAYSIGAGLVRALRHHGATGDNLDVAVREHLSRLGLDPVFADKYPDQLSGGEKRRIGIARALMTNPRLIVADEPLSGLDVVLQERVLELLISEQKKREFALIVISHDLDRVNQVCSRVLVMYSGRIVEDIVLSRNGATEIREQYRHPYSRLLQRSRIDLVLAASSSGTATPRFSDAIRQAIDSSPPASGCRCAPMCKRRLSLGSPEQCSREQPVLVQIGTAHAVACHFPFSD